MYEREGCGALVGCGARGGRQLSLPSGPGLMKRNKEEFDALWSVANYLSRKMSSETSTSVGRKMFECKTCNRQFSSFQALGGHRASHKKPKLSVSSSSISNHDIKKTTHECSICGVEFKLGQALGGHMRRHRALPSTMLSLSLLSSLPVMKKTTPVEKRVKMNGASVQTLCLDLSL